MTALQTFDFEIIEAGGQRTKGSVQAESEQAVAADLARQGLFALSISPGGVGLQRELKLPFLGSRVPTKALAVFARQFSTMTASGLTLLRALSVLEDQTDNPALKKAITTVRTDVEGGQSLSAAMSSHEKVFPVLMISLVRAGETGGFLDQALERIAINFEKSVYLRQKIRSAMTYPTIVLIFAGVMIVGVLAFIVPIFEKMFGQLGGQLPFPTRMLVVVSHQMAWVTPLLLFLTVIGITAFKRALRAKPALRLAWDTLKLKTPVVGNLLTKLAVSRFSRNLGTLLGVGVPVLQALDVVAETTGNALVAAATVDVAEAVRSGQPMSAPLLNHPVFPPMVTQMVQVGEESGQISIMLDKVADFYDREVDTATESLTATLEPLMVVLMGVVIWSMGHMSLPADVLDLRPHRGHVLTGVHTTPRQNLHVPCSINDKSPRRLTMQSTISKLRAKRAGKGDEGFTLIELLVVVVIIGVLVGIAVPVYLNFRKGAENRSAQSDVRNAIASIEQCFNDAGQVLPAASFTVLPSANNALTCGTSTQTVGSSAGNTLVYAPVTASNSYTLESTNADTKNKFKYDSTTGQTVKT